MMLDRKLCVRDAGAVGSNPITPTIYYRSLDHIVDVNKKVCGALLAHSLSQTVIFMQHAYKGLIAMLEAYKTEYGKSPAVIALGKTHLEDLQNYFEAKPDGLYFEGIEVIQHNDPIGVVMAYDNRR